MTGTRARPTRDLAQRLVEAEATIEALLSGQIDAVVDSKTKTPVLLSAAQDALRESEERYRRIVETTNEGVWVIDVDSKTTFINARMAEMLGFTVPAMIGRTPMEFLGPDGLAAFARTMAGHRAGIASQVELRFVRRDGTDLWALLGASPSFDANGRFDGSLSTVMDVTNRKRAEAELRLLETLMVAASAAPDLSAVFEVVLRMVGELTGWAFAAAWVPQRDASTL
ncbi:MAG TPA: PAS domain S-box protein, partial [Gemmatimonadaceae bacterium]|nr:PAS domain S-box protein [Gemmatimonadaceae bacterium]